MRFATTFACLLLSLSVPLALAYPSLIKRDDNADLQILNFVLSFKNLKFNFYNVTLQKFSSDDFAKAGFQPSARDRYEQMLMHEASHVEFLGSALFAAKATQVEPCVYQFPYQDVASFVSLSMMIENIGVSTLAAANALMEDKSYRAALPSISGSESRHAAVTSSMVPNQNPWNTAYETPLSMNQTYTLLAPYMQCPTSNAPLLPNVHASPQLGIDTRPKPTQPVVLDFTPPATPLAPTESLFVAWITGTGTVISGVQQGADGKMNTQVPDGMAGMGVVYCQVIRGMSDMSDMRMDDERTVAGPAVVVFS